MSDFDASDGLLVARELIPAKVRRAIYAAAALAGYALAAVAVGLVAGGLAIPTAVTVALAALGALMGPLGMLAAANVPASPTAPDGA